MGRPAGRRPPRLLRPPVRPPSSGRAPRFTTQRPLTRDSPRPGDPGDPEATCADPPPGRVAPSSRIFRAGRLASRSATPSKNAERKGYDRDRLLALPVLQARGSPSLWSLPHNWIAIPAARREVKAKSVISDNRYIASALVPTLRVGTRRVGRSASRNRESRERRHPVRYAERRKTGVPTRSVGTRNALRSRHSRASAGRE
jgi:hypothetical protein